jgi:hypothetical protein
VNADAERELERLREQLQEALTRVPLAPGSEAATIRAAHRRTRFRRGVVAATGVVLLSTGVFTATRLDTSDPGAVSTRPGTDPVASGPAPLAVPSPTVVSTAPPVATTAPDNPDEPRPAEPAEPMFRWSEVTAGPGLGAPEFWSGRVPGVVVSATASGPRAYYTSDGIAFEPLAVTPPSGPFDTLVGDGDAIYSAGVATAAASPKPVVVDISPDRGRTWTTVELPVDAGAVSPDHVSQSTSVMVSPTEHGPVVAVLQAVDLDTSAIAVLDGVEAWGMDAEGVTVFAAGCGQRVPSEPFGTAAAECPNTTYTWEELGLNVEAAALMRRGTTSRLFRLDPAGPVELPIVDGVRIMTPMSGGLFGGSGVDGAATRLFRLESGDNWAEVTVPPRFAEHGSAPYDIRGLAVAFGSSEGGSSPELGADDGLGWKYVTLTSLFDEFAVPNVIVTAATPDVMVATIRATTDLIGAEGGVEVVSGGVVVRIEGVGGEWLVLDASSREPIEGATLDFERPEGGAVVMAADGRELASLSADQLATLLVPESQASWSIASTADGVHVALEPVAELLGLVDDQIVDVTLNIAGRSVVVTARLADGDRRTLVGTPVD